MRPAPEKLVLIAAKLASDMLSQGVNRADVGAMFMAGAVAMAKANEMNEDRTVSFLRQWWRSVNPSVQVTVVDQASGAPLVGQGEGLSLRDIEKGKELVIKRGLARDGKPVGGN
jgi:hypothetical protein